MELYAPISLSAIIPVRVIRFNPRGKRKKKKKEIKINDEYISCQSPPKSANWLALMVNAHVPPGLPSPLPLKKTAIHDLIFNIFSYI